jgi:hypothetical protein
MKTMIWKELRENFKWATLALLCLTLAEFYALATERDNPRDSYNDLTMCGSTFLLVTSFGCAAIGAALGVVQILPELRRDQWAALLHRPVSRSLIFFGKVIAGLILYVFATLTPFLASAAYVAAPGQFAAPLVPGMLQPGFSDIFLGLVFYFVAILLCLHRGRWFGSRGVLGLAALPVFLWHMTTGRPFLLPLIACAFFLLAAWDTMLGNGSGPSRPWLARMARILVMLAGAQTVWLIVLFGLQFLPQNTGDSVFESFQQFEITRDGQVFFSTQHGDGSGAVVTDINGKVVTDERYVGNNTYQNLCQIEPLAEVGIADEYLSTEPRNLRNHVRLVMQSYGDKELWYQLVLQNYFIGYDKLSRRCVGLFDADGFKPAGSKPRPFPEPLKTSEFGYLLYWSGPQLYAFDFSERTMTPLFHAQDGTIFYGAANLVATDKGDKLTRVIVAMSDALRLLDSQGSLLSTIPYLHDPATWPDIWLAASPKLDRIYLQYSPDFWFRPSPRPIRELPVYLDVVDAGGNVLHTYSHPSDDFVSSPGWEERLSTVSSPLLPALAGTIYHRFVPAPPTISYFAMMSYPTPALDMKISDLAIIAVITAALGVLTFIWARGVDFPLGRAVRWALFVFCFGLPGLIAFRLSADWPVRVRCPQCGRKRSIETEVCPHCHQAWPIPHSTGAEIFELEEA